MKRNKRYIFKIISLLMITLPVLLSGQDDNLYNYNPGICILYYDHARVRDFKKFSQLPKHIRQKLDSVIHIQYKSFAKYMRFKGARQYDPSKFKDSLEGLERKMFVDVLYSLKLRGKKHKGFDKLDDEDEDDPEDLHINYIDVDGKMVEEFCVYITMDSLGRRIRPVLMPEEKWLAKGIIAPKKAKKLVMKQFEGNYKHSRIELYYHLLDKCFEWVIEGWQDKQKKRMKAVVNAHTGEIIRFNEIPRHRGGF